MVFIRLITESIITVISDCSFWGASFRRMARVVARHKFMLSAGPGGNQQSSFKLTLVVITKTAQSLLYFLQLFCVVFGKSYEIWLEY